MNQQTASVGRDALAAITEFEQAFGPLTGVQAARALAVTRHRVGPLARRLSGAPSRLEALDCASQVGNELAGAVRTLLPLCIEARSPKPERIQAVVRRLAELDGLLRCAAEEARDEARAGRGLVGAGVARRRAGTPLPGERGAPLPPWEPGIGPPTPPCASTAPSTRIPSASIQTVPPEPPPPEPGSRPGVSALP